MITMDLSLQKNNIWGDYARMLVFENGVLCRENDTIKEDEWRNGLQMEEYLHETLLSEFGQSIQKCSESKTSLSGIFV